MNDFLDAWRDFDVLDTKLEDGEYRSKLGDANSGVGERQDVAHWGLTGVVAIPDPPDADGACEAMTITDGVESRVVATRDNRYASKIGSLPAGSRGFVTRGGARMLLNPERASIVAYTERKSDGATMLHDMDAQDGVIRQVNGNTFIEQYDDKIVFGVNGGCTMTIGKGAITMTGPTLLCTMASGYFGQVGLGVPPPPVKDTNGVAFSIVPGVVSASWFFAP